MSRPRVASISALALLVAGCATCPTRNPGGGDVEPQAAVAGIEAINLQPAAATAFVADALCVRGSNVTAYFRTVPTGLDRLELGDRIRLVPAPSATEEPCPDARRTAPVDAHFARYGSDPRRRLQFVLDASL